MISDRSLEKTFWFTDFADIPAETLSGFSVPLILLALPLKT
jgi:hypothetical protein